jgi:CBS domain-containing protein
MLSIDGCRGTLELTMKIADIMTARVLTAAPTQTLNEIARIMSLEDVGIMPVLEERELVGIVTDRDMAVRGFAENMSGANLVRDVMTTQVECCRAEDDIEAALNQMALLKLRRLPVIDQSGALVGIVSLADLVRHSASQAQTAISDITAPGGPHSQRADLPPTEVQ